MHNWEKEIREHMASLDLPPETKEEVIAELASHLEDSEKEESRAKHAAQALDLSGVRWRKFSRAIQNAKRSEGRMNRTRAIWMPMFVNLLLTSALINVCDWLGWVHLRVDRADQLAVVPEPWLLVLPICGATAALLAKRGEGSSTARLIAALAPSAAWFSTLFVLKLIFVCFPQTFAEIPLKTLVWASVGWFLLPALALFAGAAPFLGSRVAKPECE